MIVIFSAPRFGAIDTLDISDLSGNAWFGGVGDPPTVLEADSRRRWWLASSILNSSKCLAVFPVEVAQWFQPSSRITIVLFGLRGGSKCQLPRKFHETGIFFRVWRTPKLVVKSLKWTSNPRTDLSASEDGLVESAVRPIGFSAVAIPLSLLG